MYTRAQLVLVVLVSCSINGVVIALFIGQSNCSTVAMIIASVSVICTSIFASCGRIAFRWANLPKGSRARSFYVAHKRARTAGWWAEMSLEGSRLAAAAAGRAPLSQCHADGLAPEVGSGLAGVSRR